MSPIRSGVRNILSGSKLEARRAPPRVSEQKGDCLAKVPEQKADTSNAITVGFLFVLSGVYLYKSISRWCIADLIAKERVLEISSSEKERKIGTRGDDGRPLKR